MIKIKAALVKELRERTGLGMMECKNALVEVDGNIADAIESLRKKSGLKAEKKSSRVAAEGAIAISANSDSTIVTMLEINCETDFVAIGDDFHSFVEQAVEVAAATSDLNIDAIMTPELEQKRNALVQKIGENIQVRRSVRVSGDLCGLYIHNNKKIGSIVAIKGGDAELAKDLAMHITATSPLVISPNKLDKEIVNKEREIYHAQMQDSGKPADILEKIIDGKVAKFLAEVSLEKQAFVKDPNIKIEQLCKQKNAIIIDFVRFEVGAGIKKEVVDFAEEVKATRGQN